MAPCPPEIFPWEMAALVDENAAAKLSAGFSREEYLCDAQYCTVTTLFKPNNFVECFGCGAHTFATLTQQYLTYV